MHRIAVVVIGLVLTLPSSASADGEMSADAKQHYDKGIAHYAAKEYEAAVAELRTAYFVEPRREIVFAWAQAERLSGDCASAIPLYRKYLASNPPAATAATVKGHMDKCIAQVGPGGEAADPTKPPPKPVAAPVAPVAPVPVDKPAPATTVTRKKPFYKDVIGDSLAIAGIAGLGAGGTFFYLSIRSKHDRDDATSYAEYEAAADKMVLRRQIAIGALAAGGALLTGAIIRWSLHGGGKETVPALGASVDAHGASVSVLGRF